jgi:hypothetical protein
MIPHRGPADRFITGRLCRTHCIDSLSLGRGRRPPPPPPPPRATPPPPHHSSPEPQASTVTAAQVDVDGEGSRTKGQNAFGAFWLVGEPKRDLHDDRSHFPTNKNHVHQDRPRFRLRACSPWRGFSLDSTLSTVQVILVAAASTLEMAWLGLRVGVARKKYGIQVSRKGVCGPGKCSASFKR